jgi:hypothetical protein
MKDPPETLRLKDDDERPEKFSIFPKRRKERSLPSSSSILCVFSTEGEQFFRFSVLEGEPEKLTPFKLENLTRNQAKTED